LTSGTSWLDTFKANWKSRLYIVECFLFHKAE
jgi:hypothetical protein